MLLIIKHEQIVKYLIEHGGNYFIVNHTNETPIENGTIRSGIRKFFKDFLIFGYSSNAKNLSKETILQKVEQHSQGIVDCI